MAAVWAIWRGWILRQRRGVGRCSRVISAALLLAVTGWAPGVRADAPPLRYFPAGPIYEYRWKLLELALAHDAGSGGVSVRLEPYEEQVTQNRGMKLLQSGAIDVLALGTNAEREREMRPIKIDILRGIIGYRIFIIRAADQERIARMSEASFKQELTFGLNSQWADLPIMQAHGFNMLTASDYESLFGMLVAKRFDAIPRGLNEAGMEVEARRSVYPQLAVERTRALYFPYPVYFWVAKDNVALANRIERGLRLALEDGSFRKLFETYHADTIRLLDKDKRRVTRMRNPILPPGSVEPDTSWWWK